jgi:hypothetical protein
MPSDPRTCAHVAGISMFETNWGNQARWLAGNVYSKGIGSRASNMKMLVARCARSVRRDGPYNCQSGSSVEIPRDEYYFTYETPHECSNKWLRWCFSIGRM